MTEIELTPQELKNIKENITLIKKINPNLEPLGFGSKQNHRVAGTFTGVDISLEDLKECPCTAHALKYIARDELFESIGFSETSLYFRDVRKPMPEGKIFSLLDLFVDTTPMQTRTLTL